MASVWLKPSGGRAAIQFDLPTGETDRTPDVKTLQIAQARRVFGPQMPEIALDQRLDFGIGDTNPGRRIRAAGSPTPVLQCDMICKYLHHGLPQSGQYCLYLRSD